MKKKYKVRDGFTVHLTPNQAIGEGKIIEIDELQASQFAHQIEEVVEKK